MIVSFILYFCLCLYLYLYLYLCLSIYLIIYLFIYLSIYLSFIYSSICSLCIYLCNSLFIYRYMQIQMLQLQFHHSTLWRRINETKAAKEHIGIVEPTGYRYILQIRIHAQRTLEGVDEAASSQLILNKSQRDFPRLI